MTEVLPKEQTRVVVSIELGWGGEGPAGGFRKTS